MSSVGGAGAEGSAASAGGGSRLGSWGAALTAEAFDGAGVRVLLTRSWWGDGHDPDLCRASQLHLRAPNASTEPARPGRCLPGAAWGRGDTAAAELPPPPPPQLSL